MYVICAPLLAFKTVGTTGMKCDSLFCNGFSCHVMMACMLGKTKTNIQIIHLNHILLAIGQMNDSCANKKSKNTPLFHHLT